MTSKNSPMTRKVDEQEYFNWGYQDAFMHFEGGKANQWATKSHPNEAYRQGYLSGYGDAHKGNRRDSQFAYDMAKGWGDL